MLWWRNYISHDKVELYCNNQSVIHLAKNQLFILELKILTCNITNFRRSSMRGWFVLRRFVQITLQWTYLPSQLLWRSLSMTWTLLVSLYIEGILQLGQRPCSTDLLLWPHLFQGSPLRSFREGWHGYLYRRDTWGGS